jgi:hypothetical protein
MTDWLIAISLVVFVWLLLKHDPRDKDRTLPVGWM